MDAKTLNARQTAEHIGVSRATFYNMLADERFNVRPIPNSRPRRWSITKVDAWIAGTYTDDEDSQPNLFDR